VVGNTAETNIDLTFIYPLTVFMRIQSAHHSGNENPALQNVKKIFFAAQPKLGSLRPWLEAQDRHQLRTFVGGKRLFSGND
jgi:hypothetical protein